MEIATVNERHLHGSAPERLRSVQSAETSTKNDNMGLLFVALHSVPSGLSHKSVIHLSASSRPLFSARQYSC
jgi:hypothetical protein